MLRRLVTGAATALVPWLLVAGLFVLVLRSGETPAPFPRRSLPTEAFRPDACTWSCHNHGCRHAPRLPAWLSGDAGLFGKTIGGLRRLGGGLLPGRPREGYGLANLLVFCLVWPGAMWGLYLLAVAQRRRLLARQKSRAGRAL